VITLRDGLALANVLVIAGREQEFHERVRTAFKLELPAAVGWAEGGRISFIGAGPRHWLAMAQGMQGEALRAQLSNALAGVAYVSDQSDGRTVFRIGGPFARDILAKGAPIDLHPRAFGVGQAAVTAIAHIGVHMWQVDEAPTYDVAVFRSYATAFWRWFAQASAEFGA
jgi:sarcosine oxidase subunit gamma